MVKIMLPVTRSKMLTRTLALMSILALISFQSSDLVETRKNTRVESNPTAADDQPTKARVSQAYGRLPLSFIANQGQTDPRVKFLSRGSGYSLYLTSTEAVLSLRKDEGGRQKGEKRTPHSSFSTLRMKMVGANPQPSIAGVEQLPGKANYFIGDDPSKWRRDVPTYAKVKYEEVYPGVEMVYYGNQGQLEYDFVVAPGADPAKIRLRFEGAQKLEVDGEGNLILHTAGGEVMQQAPIIYQEIDGAKESIAGRYELVETEDSEFSSHDVGFEVGEYDDGRPLVIDPVLIYSTYLGGGGNDFGNGIAVDTAGNAYVTGETRSTDFPTANPLQPANGGGADVFVAKLDPTGSALVYSTYLGGSSVDIGWGIGVDSAGNAYVTGLTASTDFPTANPLQPAIGGPNDAFVAALDPAGSALVYSTYLGGSGAEIGFGIAVDSAGNAHVTGQTESADFPTANPLQPAIGGFINAFVAKLDPTGSALVYSTYLGGSFFDQGFGIAVDSAGNAYVTGATVSPNFPTANPLQPTIGGNFDAFVAVLDAAGSALVYSTYLGGSGFDQGYGIGVDSAGNAYVTGGTESANFPTANPLQPANGGSQDAFVAVLDAAGSALVYSTYLGGTGGDIGFGIGVDSAGNAYVTGQTGSADFPTANPLQPAQGGSFDAFIAKIGP